MCLLPGGLVNPLGSNRADYLSDVYSEIWMMSDNKREKESAMLGLALSAAFLQMR